MPKQNRRKFIRNALATTASASVLANSRFVHAQDGQPAESKSPNSQLSVVVVGVNGRGGEHISQMLGAEAVTITHVCDIDSAVGDRRAKQISDKQGKAPKIETDIRRVLDDKSIDMVTIATPNHWHALAGIYVAIVATMVLTGMSMT